MEPTSDYGLVKSSPYQQMWPSTHINLRDELFLVPDDAYGPLSDPLANGVLCGFAGTFGLEGLLSLNINLDPLGLASALGERDLQHAFVVASTHLPRIYRTGQSK